VEVRNTRPDPPIFSRDSETLLEDLCLALRNVAVWDSDLPDGQRVAKFVAEASAVHAELVKREVNYEDRVHELSTETGWQMGTLLEDCLGFPTTSPYVREADGVRRRFRCPLCRKAEVPVGTEM
jgi:hypothetical protein